MREISKVVILGGNGAMGSGSAAVFAGAGISTVLVARTAAKAEAGKARAEQLAKRPLPVTCANYDELAEVVRDADFILEAVAEDMATKRAIFTQLDALPSHAIIASVSSGLSIAGMCEGRSPAFRARFLGVHLFNPPTVIVGCELIPHAGTAPEVVADVEALLARVGRQVVKCNDTPAFAGNRLGFRLLNVAAQLAEQYGVELVDELLGPHTGRALAPLATIDLVGWDVHKAIVDHLYAHTHDPAFVLPAFMQRGIELGHLGRKTRDKGGFFRMDKDKRQFVLDPATFEYHPRSELQPPCDLIARMKAAPGLEAMMDIACTASGDEAAILRRLLLGYISYGLGLVGEVVAEPRDIDRIMGFGFHWAPPSMLVDAIGAARTAELLEREHLPVPPAVAAAARAGTQLHAEPALDRARFFGLAA
ncbi:MAG TPA: 3-hydroxyacyl-CoA dehydrogenase NAD-binding domain-containing protein [Kofleriaceae bacterium]|nr:3-hydroxyacyl-CoA dehydrogenase NAD-binding domain-containing protein [Kofleriaceae bacterium]